MTSLEQSFAEICAVHDLTTFGVAHFPGRELRNWNADAHWLGHTNTGHNCTSGMGDTLAEAVANCLQRVAESRARRETHLADEPLPQLAGEV